MIGYGNSYFVSTILDSGVGNPPVNTVAPVISGSTTLGSVLSSTTGTWTGDPTITYSYQWYRGINAIGGATSLTYTIIVADSAANITCVVTATNSVGNSSATSNIITAQTFSAPVNTVAPAITGTAQEGQTLTCSTGTWTGTPTITYYYQWKRNGSNIGSATNSTYLLVSADVGQSIKCTVTATNGVGSANADSNTVTPIAALDPDAQAFLTAAGITNDNQQSAINQLVLDLKGYGIWSIPNLVIYPMVGGTATAHSYNLKNPAQYQITWFGGATHTANGVGFNGTNSYGNTGYNQTTVGGSLNSTHLSYYSRTNSNGVEVEIGVQQPASNYNLLEIRTSGTTYFLQNQSALTSASDSDSRGFYLGNRQASNDIDGWRNGVKLVNGTTASNSLPNANIFIGAVNTSGTALFYTKKQCAFASIGPKLTDTQAANLYTAVQAFNTTLGRQV